MNRSPLSLTNDVRFCVSGTVTIHPTAAIATGVILRANPGSCLIIGAGVVVGKGSILQAYGGPLILEDEVTLGTQVLLIGQGIVHKSACIGSLSTLMTNIAVTAGGMIAPNSLLGAPEPQLREDIETSDTVGNAAGPLQPPEHSRSNESTQTSSRESTQTSSSESTQPNPDESAQPSSSESAHENSSSVGANSDYSEIPHPNSHRMFMPINTPRYNGAADDVNAGRTVGKMSPNPAQSSRQDNHPLPKSTTSSSTWKDPNPESFSVGRSPNAAFAQGSEKDDSIEEINGNDATNSPPSTPAVIYGKSSVQRLMTMMFPYRTLNDSGDARSNYADE